MSFLLNKRKRDESLGEYNFLQNDDTSKIFPENNNTNIPEELLIEENNFDNSQKNNKLDAFQMMFQSINSKKEDPLKNNMIFSPLCSNLFYGSFQKLKRLDKIMGSNNKSGIMLSKSNSSILKNRKNKMFFSPSAIEMENNFNFETFMNNNSNNNEKMHINLDLELFNISEKKNIFDLNFENKLNEENNINDIFTLKHANFFENIKNNNNLDTFGSGGNIQQEKNENNLNNILSRQEKNNLEIRINTSIFSSSKENKNINLNETKPKKINTKNKKYKIQKILRPKNLETFSSLKKPFRTFHTKLTSKSNAIQIKKKLNKPKIFHIEKIFNKKEYKEVNEKEEANISRNHNLINKYKISLKKIKQIYLNSCLKIYSYLNDNNKYDENNLSNEEYISAIVHQVSEIIRNRQISSSKMNEILQVSDDDKYRKHYFMFSSEAKQFCLDLINKKKYPLDITMKMCKVPRKSLRRWCHVGCLRKKGCGRKTKNPRMEEQLVQWYNEIIKKNLNVTAKMIRDKAVEISNDKDFLASKGWLEKFKKKNGIQVVSSKRIRKGNDISMDYNTINYNIVNNNTISNNSSGNSNYRNVKEIEKETEKSDYEINIINDNKEKINREIPKARKFQPLSDFDDKENTNTNIYK
jgi:hypothetical protein